MFSLAGRLIRPQGPKANQKSGNTRFAVLIPAYREDSVIIQTATQALQQSYPSDAYDVVVIADSLQPDTVEQLSRLPLRVVEVHFEKSTKAKSLNTALGQLRPTDYDAVVVLDADNIMTADALSEFDRWLQSGFQAVQGKRVAKNKDTAVAFLDAISEEINNHIFRRGRRSLGLSSSLIGSAAAFDFTLFKRLMSQIEAVGGFDKELELRLFTERIKIAYAEDALVLDEKVRKSEVFYNQRRRWLSAQWRYLTTHIGTGFGQLFKGNLDYFVKFCDMLVAPRLLLLGALSLLAVGSLLLPFPFGAKAWVGLWLGFALTLLLAFPKEYFTKQLLVSIMQIPHLFWLMFRLLFNLKGANQQFIHTPHEN
ncbi:glycosyltransferase [Tellurirhabdus rosea]|uniref:glycosyltransferase n=1 Tax=Tellurirhabdus rosea TaxID=2674997 RepID=UPI002257B08D|nr:glycosyltransferase family 2 protein [Tellurirhabdus rosea]